MFGRVLVFQADLLVFSWYLLFIAGGRKKPWRGLKKSAGAKKNPSRGGKKTPAGIVHQRTGGEKKPTGFFSTPGRGQIKTKYSLNPVRGSKEARG